LLLTIVKLNIIEPELRIFFYADPDPASQNDEDPDHASHNNEDPDGQHFGGEHQKLLMLWIRGNISGSDH
jgi:hypothetical protein